MRTVELDFTKDIGRSIGEIGYVGEHNETELLITPPTELSTDSNVTSYFVVFGVGDEKFHSASIPAAETFTCLMWGDVTKDTAVTIQLEGMDTNGDLIAKSKTVIGVLAPSVQGEESESEFTPPIIAEIAANTAARHTHANKAILDAITTPPVVEISETATTSKYLPNELALMVQKGTALTYQNDPIIQYSTGLAFNFACLTGTADGTPKMLFKSVTNLGQIKDNDIFGFSSVYVPLSVNYKSFVNTNNIELKAEDITASNEWTPPYANSLATKEYVDDNKGDKLPTVTSSDEDKVLTVNASGQWVAAQPQGGSEFIITITNVGGTPTADKTESEIYQAWTDGLPVVMQSNNYRIPMITANYENGEYEFYCVAADLDTTVITYYAYYSTMFGWELDMGSYAPPVTDVVDGNGDSVINNGVVTLADVAISNSYNDLDDKPTIPAAQIQADWNEADNTALDYIKNKPTIPAAQIQSDWSQADNTKLDYIKNKPSLATVATSGSYNDLLNQPTIPTVTSTTETIEVADWNGGTTATISVTGVTASNIVMVSPSPSDYSDYASANIRATAQASGTLTFTCDITPSSDIDINIVIWG